MYDIITMGSATIDVFLKSKSKSIEIEKINDHQDICMPLGAKILIDELVTDTGGGGTNTAVAFSKFGFKTAWIGRIGNDLNSKSIEEILKKNKIDVLIKKCTCSCPCASGFSVILTGYKENRTILTYKGVNNKLFFSDITVRKPKYFYFASMVGESWKSMKKLANYANKNKIPVAFNPSLYLVKKGMRELMPVLKASKILILNKEEAQTLTRKKKVDVALKFLQKTVPLVVITDGSKGAIAFDGKIKFILKIPNIKPLETTGAGDSFASAFVASIIRKKSVPKALKNGFAQAKSVLSYYGAKNKFLSWRELNAKKEKTKVLEKCL